MFNLWICVSVVFIATCFLPANCFWFFSCPHGNGQGQAGDVCSVFCRCHAPNTCEAGIQRCALPGVTGDHCHATRPCAGGLSCHPGVQKCFHDPRRYGEPCVAGYECDSGLSCEPGVQLCFRHPRGYNEPCSAGFPCSSGLSCQPGYQRCLHHPRRENERCSAGYTCADGLVCRLCDKPYATCQLARVPALADQDYDRPFNQVAFLVTHNSFAYSPHFAVWARNQQLSVSQQLKDGVRGLMLDIFPGWGERDVRLCHETCFWSGSTNLLDTLVEIRKFLETNKREVISIFFEDYLKNPSILKGVFDQARISPFVFDKENWGDGILNWPTLTEMRRLGRLVVFNNNGLKGFPYTEYNMWYYVRENRYGSDGQTRKECVDRPESRWNEVWNDRWSLVLINWFSTAPNPLQPCLNSFAEMKDKLITCHEKFGSWANFIAVNFYTANSGGGAYQAVKWLNDRFRQRATKKLQNKVELTAKTRKIDEKGNKRGFNNFFDIITYIRQKLLKGAVSD
ncbi:LOW QUALITY PROTEIN: PI-PLC X domain-containing protein At5g67130-like [Acropora millepora]|uniref:LOW QUALITY PROTEIN: PI-PLC X domain-containing protein At5g67130-like n=1 Tax=Acropora millepora TaxID=45264 RepID=UPI001CF491F6|nr:LOW QUALITY PROTEIN: PI-PLC X domain-containing protein At5g67130-like [Acropora millepora]